VGWLYGPISRAQEIISLHAFSPIFIHTGSLVNPRLRTSKEHILIVRDP
jgi:hypothetical protein